MTQAKPRPHHLLTGSFERGPAGELFSSEKKARIKRQLQDGLKVEDPRKLDRAMEKISIACHLYSKALTIQYPPLAVQKADAKKICDKTAELLRLLDNANSQTRKRIVLSFGRRRGEREDPSDAQLDPDAEPTPALLSRITRGECKYERQRRRLIRLQDAASIALKRAIQRSERRPNKPGRPPKKTPLLERSFIHELADIWCGLHGKEFQAPKTANLKKYNVSARSDHHAARFVEVVIDQAELDFSQLDLVQLNVAVRRERIAEWKASQTNRDHKRSEMGNRDSDNANRHYLR